MDNEEDKYKNILNELENWLEEKAKFDEKIIEEHNLNTKSCNREVLEKLEELKGK